VAQDIRGGSDLAKTAMPKAHASNKPLAFVWKHSALTSYNEGEIWEDKCEVRMSGRKIWISYKGDDGPILYEGDEKSPGHFKLLCIAQKGRATLHRFPDDDILEGFWIESGYQGMWRIQLIDEE
jgi:hypothetical protein